jgi:hypothetical protein
LRQRFADSSGFDWSETPTSQGFAQRPADCLIVVNYQYFLFITFQQTVPFPIFKKTENKSIHYIRGRVFQKGEHFC